MEEQKDDDGFARITLRIPRELHERIGEEARLRARSGNAEIIDRLLESFHRGPSLLVEKLESQVEALHAKSEQYRSLAEISDHIRTLLSSVVLSTLSRLPDGDLTEADRSTLTSIATWLSTRDYRSIAHSLAGLLDRLDPEFREQLQNFASQLEDDGEINDPPIRLTIEKAQGKRPLSMNKVIIVGNLGRDPGIQSFPADRPPKKHGPQPSSNSRAKPPRKR